eukprot:6182690-Pleurochrysis_carterae.AAC.1
MVESKGSECAIRCARIGAPLTLAPSSGSGGEVSLSWARETGIFSGRSACVAARWIVVESVQRGVVE